MEFLGRLLVLVHTFFVTKQVAIFLIFTAILLVVLSQQVAKSNLSTAIRIVRAVSNALPMDVKYPSVKGFNTRTYRWACASLSEDSPIQTLSLLIVLSNRANPASYVIRYFPVAKPFLLFELVLRPRIKGLYAVLIRHHEGRVLNQAYPHIGLHVTDAKSPSIYHQAYECCSGLAESIHDAFTGGADADPKLFSVVFACVLTDDRLVLHVENTKQHDDTELILKGLASIVEYITTFAPSENQQRQITKRLATAEREMASINAQKRSEEAEETAKKLAKEYAERLKDPNLSELERAKINKKLERMAEQRRAALGRLLFGNNMPKIKPPKKSRAGVIYQ